MTQTARRGYCIPAVVLGVGVFVQTDAAELLTHPDWLILWATARSRRSPVDNGLFVHALPRSVKIKFVMKWYKIHHGDRTETQIASSF